MMNIMNLENSAISLELLIMTAQRLLIGRLADGLKLTANTGIGNISLKPLQMELTSSLIQKNNEEVKKYPHF